MKKEVNKEYSTNLDEQIELEEPSLYQVVIHNDDFTPMEFVVSVLEKFFYITRRRAIDITMEAHIKGKAAFGRYTKDVAESKIAEALDYARTHEHPLACSTEAA